MDSSHVAWQNKGSEAPTHYCQVGWKFRYQLYGLRRGFLITTGQGRNFQLPVIPLLIFPV